MAEEQDLDLVEVAPTANPPVCRLMDYGKFRYEQSKKEREARKNQRQIELKELRLKPKTDEHDIETKAKQARRFLKSGDKVKFTVRFRGREMAHTDIGRDMLDQLVEQLRDIAVVEQKPQLESKALSLVMAPDSKTLKAAQQAQRDQNKRERSSGGQKQGRDAAAKKGDQETENGHASNEPDAADEPDDIELADEDRNTDV